MNDRIELHEILCDILGNRNVYFQPPESVKLKYPAIIYNLNDIQIRHADNFIYSSKKAYTVTLVTKDPDNTLINKLLELQYCKFDRYFSYENLHHYVLTIFY